MRFFNIPADPGYELQILELLPADHRIGAQAGAADANGQNLANANAGANANANANNNGPADVIDLDDNAVPQTDNPGADIGDSDTPKGGINPVAVGGGIVGVGALAGLAAFLIKRRREAEDYE